MLKGGKIIVDTVENYNFLVELGHEAGRFANVLSHIELSDSIKSYKKVASCDICEIIVLEHGYHFVNLDGIRCCKKCAEDVKKL
ncbi:hypothetical protein U0E09_32990 [Bacillus thuringiensis]|uniref:Uncharacterized protein n=2 Tax=Bacillus cereus group TaxID=86661 RepID=A0AAN4KL44_BACTU|nr:MULTISPECIES: hypothetical protein [Bacillus]ERH96450.1 hypothetical protein BTCBT_007418 [Bacillus thuringiensis T01-328]MBN6708339.1 hypothetical protein [Bacillus thuringiensis]MDQ7259173.1 hypothetical protein [Bacillus thuringiensis]MDV6354399.1 hypothetical protein [Bacillus thuringiensis]MDY7954843.1 hypothetical protein [Bacillus thuringiensis]